MIKFLEKNKWVAIILTVLIAIEIFYVSSISSIPSTGEGGSINLALLYHVMVFFLFAFFLTATIKGKGKLKIKHLILILAVALIYAILDEVHQIFVPGRVPAIKDVLIDCIGIILAVLIYPKKKIEK